MIKTFLALMVAMMCLVSSPGAVVIEIPLPELHGTYPPIDSTNAARTVGFVLPQIPAEIYGAWFRISGTTEVGSASCSWGGPYPRPMDIGATMRDTAFAHFWIASEHMPEVAGPFGWTAEFRRSPSTTTWDFLMDGEGELTLTGAPIGLVDLCWPVGPDPTATVTEAVLIIDAEFPIPVKPETWGKIKALYYEW